MRYSRGTAGATGMRIKNRDQLASQGDVAARTALLQVVESTLEALDISRVLRSILALRGDTLQVGERQYRLGPSRRLFVIGAGKAGNAMARAVEEVLGDRITRGLVIVKRAEMGDALRRIDLVEGGHPI